MALLVSGYLCVIGSCCWILAVRKVRGLVVILIGPTATLLAKGVNAETETSASNSTPRKDVRVRIEIEWEEYYDQSMNKYQIWDT
jgi:hypothetical protein